MLLADWLALSPAQLSAMRMNTKTCFAKHFEIENVTQNLLKALDEVSNSGLIDHTFQGHFSLPVLTPK